MNDALSLDLRTRLLDALNASGRRLENLKVELQSAEN